MTYARPIPRKRGWRVGRNAADLALKEFACVSVALSVCVVVPASVAMGAGLGPVLVALVLFAVSASVAGRAMHLGYPHLHLGLCNAITLARLALAAALVAALLAGSGPSWTVFAVAALALGLDGIDGWLARRQGYVSAFGARFDMEVDSVLALVLALGAAVSTSVGPFVILLGLPRYLFAVARWALPWMRRDLPDRFSRKAACVVQLATLIALQMPILSLGLAVPAVALAVLAVAVSFAGDVAWLWRRRT